MTMNIGETLKLHRLQKGQTQEQLAEVFGVSPQAVSRWENNTSYPDITLLPSLAVYFDTTVDALLGMDSIRDTDAIRRIHTEARKYTESNQPDEAISLYKESLLRYPNNSGLLLALAEALAQKAGQTGDDAVLSEATTLLERALLSDLNMKAKSTATAHLLFLYLKVGKNEQAAALLQTLPHLWESRELLTPELHNSGTYPEALKTSIHQALQFFCSKIKALPSRSFTAAPAYLQTGFNFTSKETTEDILNLIRDFLSPTHPKDNPILE